MEYRWFFDAFQDSTGREPSIDSEQLQEFLSPEHFVAVRERLGGPGPEALRGQLKIYRERSETLHHAFLAYGKQQEEAAVPRQTLTKQYRQNS